MKWRDPVDGHVFWEPPGGGIEASETPFETAIRELYEATGYTEPVTGAGFLVDREYIFAGRAFRHTEAFFVAEVSCAPRPGSLTDEEQSTLIESRFVAIPDIAFLDAPIQPPNLRAILAQMLES